MSVDYRGSASTTLVDAIYSQRDGSLQEYRERGLPSVILSDADLWANAGYDVTTDQTGPYWSLTATKNIGGPLPLITQWRVSTELIQKPIWSLPAVMSEAESFSGGLCKYRKGIEDAVSKGEALSADYTGLAQASFVLSELRRGANSYEHDYTILSRSRQFDRLNPPSTISFNHAGLIYTTAQLQVAEGIPSRVLFNLPVDPGSSEPQTIWGWRQREQTAEIQDRTTGSHQASWVYAQWSTFLYNPA